MANVQEIFDNALREHQLGNLEQAESLYRSVLESEPTFTNAGINLGSLLVRAGRFEEGIAEYQKVLRSNPAHSEAWYNLGNAWRRLERHAEATGAYQSALRHRPDHLLSMHNMALSFQALDRIDDAMSMHELTIKTDIGFFDGYLHVAELLARQGKFEQAVGKFQQAIQIRPNDPRAHHLLGLTLHRHGNTEQGISCIRYALQLKPDYAEALNTLGVALDSLDRTEEAWMAYRRSIELKGDFADALNNLANLETEQANHEIAIQARRMALNLRPNMVPVHSNLLLLLHYPTNSPPEILSQEHRLWSQMHAEALLPMYPRQPSDPDPERRLKIGYVSADFRNHPVARLIEPLLTTHDREKFQLIGIYSNARSDETTSRFQGYFDQWIAAASMSDRDLAEKIRDEDIDILVDLSGHTAGNRLLTFAMKPAPIQIAMLGYPATTGMTAIDYRLTDTLLDPPGNEAFHTETLVRIPESVLCWQPPAGVPEVSPGPAERNGYVTFGCLNNLAKVTPTIVACWAQILEAVPNSKFLLLTGRGGFGTARIRDFFQRQKVSPDRLLFLPRQPTNRYHELYQLLDIALDPAPYNGGVTTFDALWQGVPVVSLAGRHYVSRQGAAILTILGLTNLIGSTPEEYIARAVELANAGEVRKDLRNTLRSKLRNSPLMDAAGYARRIETAYRSLWRQLIETMG